MTEKYTTLGSSTLASDYLSGSGLMVVTSASSFPSSATFRIRVANNAIYKVTNVSGTNFSVSLDHGSDDNAASGANIKEVLTAEALDQIRSDLVQRGVAALRPSSEKDGILYLSEDNPFLFRDNGSVWHGWGPLFRFTDPTLQTFAWVNQGSATVAATNHMIHLVAPATSGQSLRIRKKAAPSTPYTITLAFLPLFNPESTPDCGFVWRTAASGKLSVIRFIVSSGQARLHWSRYDSETAYNSDVKTYADFGVNMRSGIVYVRVKDDGTNRLLYYSNDGVNFLQLTSQVRTDFDTPDEVGFYVNAVNATNDAAMTLLSWKEE